ncbi:MAG: energy transducer TonB [Muribaculaceae bacterium]|nr:energy transducer TonB [Muribaculaceae bacterium]MDE5967938.1 energy transducer TonB [Muribaculaceae bacterium]MDE7393866.1 energy transducer TonB [Muribaculaceae bacterium]
MAKDIDLSSREWSDLIFDGRNKEYGAYQLRVQSEKRHVRAILYAFAGLAILAGLIVAALAWKAYSDEKEAERLAALQAELDQQAFEDLSVVIEEEEIEENQMEQEEIEIPEALEEEILNTQQFTEFIIVDNDREVEQVATQEDVQQNETAIGNTNFDKGTDDINIVREHQNEIIVEEKKPEPVNDNQVFTSVEQMPQFPGGEAELLKWIGSHVKYPPMAMENGIQGRVQVRFVVTKDGSVGEVQVIRGKDPDLDKEAVRVIKSLPKFNPGRMNGQPVNVWYTVPINFRLQGM